MQFATFAMIRSHALIGVLSTRPESMSLAMKLVSAATVSLRLIGNHLSGRDRPSIYKGKVDPSAKVKKYQAAISAPFGKNVVLKAVEDNETAQTTKTSDMR